MYDWAQLARVDFGMRMGIRGVADAVAWADAEILRLEPPPDELFALSLAGSLPADEMLRRLAPIVERAPSEAIVRARAEWAQSALARLDADASAGPSIADAIYRMADSRYFPATEYEEIYWITEVFTDLGTGLRLFGFQLTRNPAVQFIREFLERVGGRAPRAPSRAG